MSVFRSRFEFQLYVRRHWIGTLPPSGQVIAVAQVVETNTAQAIAKLKTKAVSIVVEADLSQPIWKLKTRAIGQPIETDTAQAISKAKLKTLAQVVETDLAQTINVLGSTIVGVSQVVETDTAQPIGKAKTKAVGQVTETDTAQGLTKVKTRSVAMVVETDLAQPITRGGIIGVGQIVETDLAQPIAVVKAGVLPIGGAGGRRRKAWPLPPPAFPLVQEENNEVLALEKSKPVPHWTDRIERKPLTTFREVSYIAPSIQPVKTRHSRVRPPLRKPTSVGMPMPVVDEEAIRRKRRRAEEEMVVLMLVMQGEL